MKSQYNYQATLFGGKFVPGGSEMFPSVMIADPVYWQNHESEIHAWMADNLTKGVEHHTGMVITFDNDQQRFAFLLRWG